MVLLKIEKRFSDFLVSTLESMLISKGLLLWGMREACIGTFPVLVHSLQVLWPECEHDLKFCLRQQGSKGKQSQHSSQGTSHRRRAVRVRLPGASSLSALYSQLQREASELKGR